MPHYTDIGLNEQPTRRVCQYCGRPLKTNTSMNQGCGEVCRMRHRKSRYRVVTSKEEQNREQFVRFEESK